MADRGQHEHEADAQLGQQLAPLGAAGRARTGLLDVIEARRELVEREPITVRIGGSGAQH